MGLVDSKGLTSVGPGQGACNWLPTVTVCTDNRIMRATPRLQVYGAPSVWKFA